MQLIQSLSKIFFSFFLLHISVDLDALITNITLVFKKDLFFHDENRKIRATKAVFDGRVFFRKMSVSSL